MNIVVLGANGRTGRLVVRQALAAGHSVTGLVRSPDSIVEEHHYQLRICIGDVTDPGFLKSVFPGHDAVISTVGPRSPMKSACDIYPDSAAAVASAMQASGLKRVLITSTALLFHPAGFIDRALRVIAKNNRNAAALMEKRIRDADLDYTFARTGFLTDGDDSRFIKAESEFPAGGGPISRSALANFLLVELEQSGHVGRVVGLSAKKST